MKLVKTALKILLIAIILLINTIQNTIIISADLPIYSYISITFTPQGEVTLHLTDFIATYIDDSHVRLTWTNPDPSNITAVIIGKQGEIFPISSTDGYTIYTGNSNITFDNTMDTTSYAAFALTNGTFSIPVFAQAGGAVMSYIILLGFFIVSLSLFVYSTISKNSLFGFISSIFFILTAWFSYTKSVTNNDLYYISYIVGCFMIAISVISSTYISYEDRKSKRVYAGGMIRDSTIERSMSDNDELISFHRNSMHQRKRKKGKGIDLSSTR
jgi:hypothetical protein